MQLAGIVAHAGKISDGDQRREPADGQGQCTKHAQFRAIVALVAVEGIADEAAKTGAPTEQADLPLELDGRGGNQGNAQRAVTRS